MRLASERSPNSFKIDKEFLIGDPRTLRDRQPCLGKRSIPASEPSSKRLSTELSLFVVLVPARMRPRISRCEASQICQQFILGSIDVIWFEFESHRGGQLSIRQMD